MLHMRIIQNIFVWLCKSNAESLFPKLVDKSFDSLLHFPLMNHIRP